MHPQINVGIPGCVPSHSTAPGRAGPGMTPCCLPIPPPSCVDLGPRHKQMADRGDFIRTVLQGGRVGRKGAGRKLSPFGTWGLQQAPGTRPGEGLLIL